jgi:hypothetical protein
MKILTSKLSKHESSTQNQRKSQTETQLVKDESFNISQRTFHQKPSMKTQTKTKSSTVSTFPTNSAVSRIYANKKRRKKAFQFNLHLFGE